MNLRGISWFKGRSAKTPEVLDRKHLNAAKERRWQWVFSQENRWKKLRTGEEGRHHIYGMILQRAVEESIRKVGVIKHVGFHNFRHSLGMDLLEAGY